jgi:RNA polymerase sigma-70 factor (ECF subfamily)
MEALLQTPPQTGPTEAEIRALYERYGPVLLHRCRRLLGSTELAQDALHETFARVIRNWASFRGDSSPLTWMYQISTNLCLNQLRNKRTRAEKFDVYEADFAGDGRVQPGAASWERQHVVRRLLAEVDSETRAVVVALYFDDLSLRQCATRVGLSVPTVRKRMAHFLKRSRRVLASAPGPLVAAFLALIQLAGMP